MTTTAQRLGRVARVAVLHGRGWTPEAIALEFGVSRRQVDRDLATARVSGGGSPS